MEYRMKISILILLLAAALADVATAQVVLQKVVISNAGGQTANSTTRLNYTVGETAVGVASNSTTIGRFGFWHSPTLAASVKENGVAAIGKVAVYPNPASSTISIDVNMRSSNHLDLRLYNTAGELITTLYAGKKSAGDHSFKVNLGHVASGRYYVAALTPGGLLQTPVTIIR